MTNKGWPNYLNTRRAPHAHPSHTKTKEKTYVYGALFHHDDARLDSILRSNLAVTLNVSTQHQLKISVNLDKKLGKILDHQSGNAQ